MSKTALVVDDSKSARFALRKFLEGFNYQVETAENANEAYAALARGLPDVVFMDHIMPGVDGFEALRTIKANAQMASVPVVICSSNEGEAFVAEAHARGASGVLQKPPSPEQIAGLLANLTTRAPSTLPSEPQDEHPLARTLAPAASAPRDPTPMERLMATIPPKLIPTAHLVHQTATVPPPSNPPPPIISALPITSPKVQPLREPAVTIQQAVMKSIRDSMQGETLAPLAGTAPSAPAPAPISLGAMPSLTASSERSSTQDLEEQLGALRQQLLTELAALRGQIANLSGASLDERLRTLAGEAAKARTQALANTIEQHLAALRGNLDGILRAQNERIEQLMQVARQTAAEEAERAVMKAAQRISDQMAESILKTLGPQISALRR